MSDFHWPQFPFYPASLFLASSILTVYLVLLDSFLLFLEEIVAVDDVAILDYTVNFLCISDIL